MFRVSSSFPPTPTPTESPNQPQRRQFRHLASSFSFYHSRLAAARQVDLYFHFHRAPAMIDSVTIFTKGGTVLYHNQSANSIIVCDKENNLSMINHFISSILLENKPESNREVLSFNEQNVVAEWLDGSKSKVDGGCIHWIVLVLYPDVALRKLSGVDALLSSVMKRYALFYDHHKQNQTENGVDSTNLQLYVPPRAEFDTAYESILRRFQDQLSNVPHNKQQTQKPNSQKGSSNNLKKKGKEKTVWHDGKGKVTKEALASLDMSKDAQDSSTASGPGEIREDSRAIAEAHATYMPSNDEKPAWEEEDETDFDIQWGGVEVGEEEEEQASGLRGFFSKLLTPNAPLTKADLEPPLKQMKELLTSKNVAVSTAQAICDVVERQLLGKKVGTLVGVKRAVRHALEDAVERILRPELGGIGGGSAKRGKSVDVLRGVVEKREKGKGSLGLGSSNRGGRPFVIVMIGINGVGKSTSLAKIAYYLQSNLCNPLLAACDTFRSGAVEQLSVHAKCLSLPLYHQGYAKDPASVAKAAISKAAEDGNDVVMIDTAGRMQNNVPLMKALAKLVTETSPDLVLFVCEALVGNDGMDQLSMFQKALTTGGHTRPIDGIVLTKFDTVSDKVGAALTLTHLTGVPIAFCGTGQKYNHLKPLSVPYVIQSLFS
ncbi:hypothetical protein ACHAXN_007024 [Cyclotella atomus]